MRHTGPPTIVSLLLVAACTTPPRSAAWEAAPEAAAEPTVAEPAATEPAATEPEAAQPEAAQPEAAQPEAAAPAAEPAGTVSQDQDATLREEAEILRLKQQRKQILVEEHLERARELRGRLRFEEAEEELLAARALDPANLTVKKELAEVQALLGKQAGRVTTVTEEMSDRYALRVQQLRADAAESLRKGTAALARGDYDAAIAELTIGMNQIRWAPYSIDWQGLDQEIADLLETAKTQRDAAQRAEELEAQRKAHEALLAEARAEEARQRAVVDNMLAQAIDAFEGGDYDDAIYYADLALRKDPRNERAAELRDAAFRAGREQVRADYVERKREQFARWKEQLDSYRIPWSDPITLPDPDRWAEITEIRRSRRGIALEQSVDPGEAALREQLRTTLIKLPEVRDEESLTALFDHVKVITGLPIVVDPAAENAALDNGVILNFSFENDLSVEQVLNLVTDMAGEEVTWTIRHDAVIVTTKERARAKPVVVHHDVEDLVFGLTDFMGPRIDRIRLLDNLEDDDGGGPFGGIGERSQILNPDDLATLIQENVAVGAWDEGATIESFEGSIIVVATPEVQEEVRQFLADLRRFSSSLVTIEAKFMTVSQNWIQQIGVDWRGLDQNPLSDVTNGLEDNASRGIDNGGTGAQGPNAAGAPSSGFYYDDGGDGDFRGRVENFFGDPLGSAISTVGGLTFQLQFFNDLQLSTILRAVEKSNEITLINDQMISVHNTQRAYVTVINQRAYIQDFDVEVAQFQAVADPQVNVLHEGVVLDVRPTIHHNRKYLRLEIQPTVANVVALRNFSSTLGGNTSPVEFQLPEIEVQSVFTTADIPDGGSVLLGGLSNVRNIERRAEVPWLARIPIVGFLFKSEGYNDEKKSLMILIRAQIRDVREEVKKIEASY